MAVGPSFMLSFLQSGVSWEPAAGRRLPVATALDLMGVPWLVTERTVLRRHVESGIATWRTYDERDEDRPPLVAIGFTPEEARVLDARGDSIRIRPLDLRR